MLVYDLETFNTERVEPFAFGIYRLSKLSGEYYRDISQREYELRRSDCIIFKESNCINEMLDHVLIIEGEAKRVKNKIVNYNIYISAHNGSGFDNYAVLKKLLQ